ncbi:trans-2-enoyl-CoA reductase, partial [Peribacillus simplex]|nr:trans-2-enoyl-CoA reductase [Peribacillus simplex]
RETEKIFQSDNPIFVDSMRRRFNKETKEKERYRLQYQELMREVQEKFGTRWRYS